MSLNVVAFADRLVWDKVPLKLDLEIGEERYIHFEFPTDVGVPENLIDHLRVQVVGNSVYLTAARNFERQRFLFRSRDDGSVIVVDIKAALDSVGSEHVYISQRTKDDTNQSKKHWTPALLTKFAARYMYAPKRLRMSAHGLASASLPKSANRLLRDERIEIQPYRSWKTQQDLFVAVVVLTNHSDQAIELHPSMLRGKWVAATFHHYRLLPSTTNANITTLYLVSDQPFGQALEF